MDIMSHNVYFTTVNTASDRFSNYVYCRGLPLKKHVIYKIFAFHEAKLGYHKRQSLSP